METLPVTLIVKAPNQQIEDQQIKCELSWTIHKLKQHLSEVYPSKPPKHEQKLIYSGQLLNDSVTLKDVLRQYEGQETHTVHLVCTPKHMSRTPPRQQQQQPQLDTTTSQNRPGVTQQPQRPQNMSARTENQPASQRGLPQPQPPHIQNTNAGAPIGGGYAGIPFVNAWGQVPPAGDLNQYAEQMAWMQQAYMQYMTQYMQLAANSYARQPIPNYLQYHGVAAAGPELAAPQQNPAAAAPEQEQPAAAPRVVVAAAVADPDNQQERDWLDIFYVLSRAMVLFSVVYFYSSPLRFVFVLLLGFALYLYHIGFFRNINNNNNNNNTVPADGAAAAGVQQQQEEPQAPSRLMVVWTFFATFFASLIPEIPNAV